MNAYDPEIAPNPSEWLVVAAHLYRIAQPQWQADVDARIQHVSPEHRQLSPIHGGAPNRCCSLPQVRRGHPAEKPCRNSSSLSLTSARGQGS